ncbi:MAG: hypothetical protein FWC78_02835 [Defluviitaleaceae bacterium]|nr:hypothetical protein [Defluviitaleaceae bacterium]
MANIRQIKGKTGTSYQITVTHGRDMNGNIYAHFIARADEQAAKSIADAILRQPKKPVSATKTLFAKTAF